MSLPEVFTLARKPHIWLSLWITFPEHLTLSTRISHNKPRIPHITPRKPHRSPRILHIIQANPLDYRRNSALNLRILNQEYNKTIYRRLTPPKMASASWPITIMRPFAPLGRTRAPRHKKASGLTKSRTACRKRRPCFDRALGPSRTPFQGVGARHARSFASARGSAPAYRALETRTLLFFFQAQARDGSESRSTFIFWIRLS